MSWFCDWRSALERALGYGWRCPYCGQRKEEGLKTGVYYDNQAVCGTCAPRLQAVRRALETKL